MLNSSVLGAGLRSFQTKAEALQYAIDFTAIRSEEGFKADYEAAQEMFDFINKNVKLPETKSESLDSFIDRSTVLMESLQKKVDAQRLHPEEYPETEHYPEPDAPCPEAPPARPSEPKYGEPDGPYTRAPKAYPIGV